MHVNTDDRVERVRSRNPPSIRGAGWLVILTVASLALTGCLAPFQYERPAVKLNEGWSQNAARVEIGAADGPWWQVFGDPTLDRLIEIAQGQNLPLQAAGLRIYEARAQLAFAVGRKYPQYQVAFAEASAVGFSDHGNSFLDDRNFGTFQTGFDAEWELDFWGRFRGDVQAQTAEHLASVADYQTALVSLNAEVARTYAVIRTLRGPRRAGARERHAPGGGPADRRRALPQRRHLGARRLTQARTLLESTRATIPQLEISLRPGAERPGTLLGQPPGLGRDAARRLHRDPRRPAAGGGQHPRRAAAAAPGHPRVELLGDRAVGNRIGVARADLYPRFSLFGTLGLHTTSGGGTQSNNASLGDLFSGGSIFYAFGPRLIWPFLNYGRIKNNVRIQDARFQQLLVDYQNTVLLAAQEVEDGLVGLREVARSRRSSRRTPPTPRSSRPTCRWCSTARARSTTSACSTRSASLLQEQITLTQTRSSIATNLDRAVQGAGRRLGAAAGAADRAGQHPRRDGGADRLGRPPRGAAAGTPNL